MFKRTFLVITSLILALSLAACSSPTPTTPDPIETGKIETIHTITVDFEENDIIVIKDYQGKYSDTLEPLEVEFPGEGSTYQVAVFGNIVNLYMWAGKQNSEAFTIDIAHRVSNKLITFKNAPPAEGDHLAGIGFMDANGENYNFSFAADADHKGVMIVADSGIHNPSVTDGHILLSTHTGEGYTLTVEALTTELVQNEPVNYLYFQRDGQDKILLAQSVDQGDDWTESIRNILNPLFFAEEDRIYYVTDIESRTSGAGAHNLFTRVIDLTTNEDRLLSSGELVRLLPYDDIFSPYGGTLILKGHELSDDRIIENYFLVNAEGETLCYLGTSLEMYEMDLVEQINQAMK